IASRDRSVTPFVDTLFTAASATCVTGLVIYDTYTHWSLFGQIVIISLIQIGGLGFVTMAIAIVTFTKLKIGFSQRLVMQESIAGPRVGGIVRMARFAISGALIFEGTGAFLMALRLVPRFGFFKGLYFSIFHSVSAFCNAGFDLMGAVEPRSSLVHFNDDPLIILPIGFLIIIGGLGFFVWDDIKVNRLNWKKYSLHSKMVITTTAFLIIAGTLMILAIEYNAPSFKGLNFFEKVMNAFFQAVTPRTAGYNSVNTSIMLESSLFLTIALMLIGGSPGSTAGGIKTTTFATLMLNVITVSKKRSSLQIFHRRIDDSTLRSAVTIASIYLILFFFAAMSISIVDGFTMLQSLFESASAIGTVGLTTGITQDLGTLSKLILTFLMYFGRVGCLTLIYAIATGNGPELSKQPYEKIAVG
ncbi:MAG: potassium transporter TrkG, partial [Eubacteriales bacterium]